MDNVLFLSNHSKIRFLDKLILNLNTCTSFSFSVSFIKKAGLVLFEKIMEEALKRGVKAKIITSTYQNFTDISSLETFLKWQREYPNFECHLDYNSFGEAGFHTKGYFFEFQDHSEVLIGSSNITRFALLYNQEWDVAINSNSEPVFQNETNEEFNKLWTKTFALTRELIVRYEMHINYSIEHWDMDYFNPIEELRVRPNSMQQHALAEIRRYRNLGQNKALVVAATGSGKTYLSAFDAKNFESKKLLFIAHKDMILKSSLETFRKVFGISRTYGMYVGGEKTIDSDFIFASNQMVSRHLDLFAPDEFDYIVIDEVHHAAASTYKEIIEYFKPQFLLGLTATPDRMDGQDVYEMFGNNVPYDLRLREALENDLIVPFHYYGISDELIDYGDDISAEGIRKVVMQISSSLHCEFIRDQIEAHRPIGEKLKCVAFCRNKEHARLMAQEMELLGYNTAYLTGNDSTGTRIKIFHDLEEEANPLEIVFAIDILNEGIDIPSINMVLFLRPTQSSTIFIQQLGRGLRKYKDKKYLTVLDFIANSYKRSVQIAVALGSLKEGGVMGKAELAYAVTTNFKEINVPGLEIHLDEKAKEEILSSIENENFNSLRFLKQDYQNFKDYLKLKPGEYPKHMDFLNSETTIDLLRFTKKYKSYYEFLAKMEKDIPIFTEAETKVINHLYYWLPLVRLEEYSIMKEMIEKGEVSHDELKEIISHKLNFTEDGFAHAIKNLTDGLTYMGNARLPGLIDFRNGIYKLAFSIENKEFKDWILDMIEYGLTRYEAEYFDAGPGPKIFSQNSSSNFLLGLKALNTFRMSGIHSINDKQAFFIDLDKTLQKNESLKFVDKFIAKNVLQWESQNGTTLTNEKGLKLLRAGEAYIFVRKIKKVDGAEEPFTYCGIGQLTNWRESGKKEKTLLCDIVLSNDVPEYYRSDFGIDDLEKNSA